MSQEKKSFMVSIGGRVYRLMATESEDYIRTLSYYVNEKLNDMAAESGMSAASLMNNSTFPIILALNIADDFYKSKDNNTIRRENIKNRKESESGKKYLHTIEELKKEIQELNDKNNLLKNSVENAKKDYLLVLNQLHAKTSEVSKINSESSKNTEGYRTALADLGEEKKLVTEKMYEIEILKKNAEESAARIAELEDKNKFAMSALRRKEQEAEELLEKHKKEINAMIAKKDSEYIMALRQKEADFKAEIAKSNNDIKGKTDELNRAAEENAELKKAAESFKNTAESLENNVKNVKEQLSRKTDENTVLSQKIHDKNQELNNLSKKLADKNAALNELNKKSAERNIKLSAVNKERDDLAVKLKAANVLVRTLTEENTKLAAQNTQPDEAITVKAEALKQKNEMLESKLNEAMESNKSLSKRVEELEDELKRSKDELQSFIDEFDK